METFKYNFDPESNRLATSSMVSHETQSNDLLQPDSANLTHKAVMLGLGFGKQGVPFDLLTLLLAAKTSMLLTLVIVDEFAVMNGADKNETNSQAAQLELAISVLQQVFNLPVNCLRCSAFMKDREYHQSYNEIEARSQELGLQPLILECVPERHRKSRTALAYPLHEIAVTQYLSKQLGVEVKLGPSKERVYDHIMRSMQLPIGFAYAIDALPVRTMHPSPVIHYIPNHKAKGERMMLDTGIEQARDLLRQSHADTLRYFLCVASNAGKCLWQPVLH